MAKAIIAAAVAANQFAVKMLVTNTGGATANAVTFTERGQVTIRVALVEGPDEERGGWRLHPAFALVHRSLAAPLAQALADANEDVRRTAAAQGKDIEVVEHLCEGAFEAVMAGETATHDRIAAAFGVERETRAAVVAEAGKVRQVLINLLENAAVHGPDEHTVFLRAEMQSAWVRVSVRDEGEPLPKGAIDRLFEPHSRGRGVKAKGTGLGLYIVRSIAGRWGGEAWGRPLDEGNEFGFTVPLR